MCHILTYVAEGISAFNAALVCYEINVLWQCGHAHKPVTEGIPMQLLINQQQPFVASDQNRTYLSMKIMKLKLSLSCFRLSRPARMKTIETMTGPILRITTAAHPQGNKPSITEIPFTITDTKQSPTRHKTVDIVWNFYGTNWNADACDWCSQNWGMIEHRNRIVLCSKDVCCRPRMGYPAVDQWFIFWTPGKLCWADTLHIFNETFRRLCLLIKKYYLV